jgi:hypothetical protein
LSGHPLDHSRVFSQIDFCPHDEEWHVRAVMAHFLNPSIPDIVERCAADNMETDEKYVGLWV